MSIKSILRNVSCFALVLILSFIFLANTVSAETKTFIKEYTYLAGDVDSKISSRIIAIEQVKRLLLEELGTALISETVVTNGQITEDQIVAFSAGIVKTTIIEEHWDGKTFRLKARIVADPEEVVRFVQGVLSDQNRAKELSAENREMIELTTEIENLKAELRKKPDSEKLKRYEEAVAKLTAFEWFKKAIELMVQVNLNDKEARLKHINKIREVIDALDNVLVQIPDFSLAYQMRGVLYLYGLEEYAKAIADFDSALFYNNWNVKGITFKETAPEKVPDIQVDLIQMKASAQLKLREYVDCINTLERGLRIKPHSINFSEGLEWKEADLNLLVNKYPKDYRTLIYRGIYFSFNRYIDRKKYAESALRDFQKAATLNKREPLIYYFLANTLFYDFESDNSYNRSSAMKYLEQAAKLHLSPITGKLIYRLKANALTGSTDFAGALKAYDKALEYSKDDGGIYIDKASVYLRMKKNAEAISEYDKALSASHKEYMHSYGNDFINNVYLYRAWTNREGGNLNNAVADYTKYIDAKKSEFIQSSLNPYDFLNSEYRDRGKSFLELGKYREAVDDLTNALAGRLPDKQSYQPRAQAYTKMGDYEAALKDNNQLIKLWKDDKTFKQFIPAIYVERGIVFLELKKYREAIDDFDKALEIYPEEINALRNRGYAYYYTGIYDQALKDFNSILAIAPDFAEILVVRGNIQLMKGNNNEAIVDFNKAITIDPKYDNAYHSRGTAYLIIGQKERGLQDFLISARLGNEAAQKYLQDNKLTW